MSLERKINMLTYYIHGEEEEKGTVDDFIRYIKPYKERFNGYIHSVEYTTNTDFIFRIELNFGAVDVVCYGEFEKELVKELQTKTIDLIF